MSLSPPEGEPAAALGPGMMGDPEPKVGPDEGASSGVLLGRWVMGPPSTPWAEVIRVLSR